MKHKKIDGKDVYIAEDHHHVLEAWAICNNNLGIKPVLLSLDHHTDTIPAFQHHCYNPDTQNVDLQAAKGLLSTINHANLSTVRDAIALLRKDEQITAAVGSNIIEKAFIISYVEALDDPESIEMSNYQDDLIERLGETNLPTIPIRPFTYPQKEIYVVGNSLEIITASGVRILSGEIEHFNHAIESDLLESRLQVIHEIDPHIFAKGQFLAPYILDIDLDYFHTMDSIKPTDSTVFHCLIQKAEIITVATEPTYVDEWKEFDGKINSVDLLKELMTHIRTALA